MKIALLLVTLTLSGAWASQPWVTLDNQGHQFQRGTAKDPANARRLREAQDRFLRKDYSASFVDGMETYYSDESQAWRLLGFYIDCEAREDNYAEDGRRMLARKLEGEDDDADSVACERYLLWAAVRTSEAT